MQNGHNAKKTGNLFPITAISGWYRAFVYAFVSLFDIFAHYFSLNLKKNINFAKY